MQNNIATVLSRKNDAAIEDIEKKSRICRSNY
jgi:hypothetical protein